MPKYSRRAQLAAGAAIGANAAFNRNLANRLWAQMMGRGLVHPLDLEHSGNPAVHSQLLALLADELGADEVRRQGFPARAGADPRLPAGPVRRRRPRS